MSSTNGQAELVPVAWDQSLNWLEMAPDNMQALVWQAQCQSKLGAVTVSLESQESLGRDLVQSSKPLPCAPKGFASQCRDPAA